MANNSQFNIRIVVTDSGGAKLAEKNVRQLGATVQNTGKQFGGANKEAGNFYDTQAKGIIGTANSTKSFSKLAETIGGNSSGLVAAYATLAANIFAATAAFNALRSASQVEQIFRGLEAAGIRTGRSLTTSAKALKEVTNNAISTEQALRSSAQVFSAGFNDQALLRLGKAARDTSFALGRNVTDALDRLTRGVVKLEPELLDELGIMTKLTESNTLYASSIGKTESQLTNYEKRQGFLNAVLAEAELKFGGLSDAAGDTTNFDKLASTLVDLSNKVLSVINTIATPLAGLLSSSFLTLAGVGTLFAATLKNQLAPGLLNSAAAASKAAKAMQEDAEAKKANIQATRDYITQQRQQRIEGLANADYVGNKAPKGYKALSGALKNGTAEAKDYRAAIISLDRSIKANQALMANSKEFAAGTARGNAKLQEIENADKQMRAIALLQAARFRAANADVSNTEQVTRAQKQAAIAYQLAAREAAAASALEGAANFNRKQAIEGIVAATKEHYKGLQLSTEATSAQAGTIKAAFVPAMNTLRTATYAASLSVKALGAAFLNAIPLLGQLLFVAGLLSTAWEAMKSEKTKKMEKAFSDLGEVTSHTTQYINEMNRANAQTAPVALRVAQSMTIQAGAVTEVNDKLQALLATQKLVDSQGREIKSSGVSSFFGSGDSKGFASYVLQVDKASEALKVFQNELPSAISPTGGIDKDPILAGTIKSLDSMLRLAPETTIEVAKLYGGLDNIGKMRDPQKKLQIIQDIISKSADKYAQGAARVEGLQQAFKALDQSISDFSLASIVNTQYDQVVKNFDSVTLSIKDLRETAEKTGNIDWQKLLGGLGPGATKFLDVQTQSALSQVKIADQIVQSLKQEERTKGSLSNIDAARLRQNQNILDSNKGIYDSVEKQIEATRQMFIEAQNQQRIYKSQLDLLNAHIQANQALYAAAGAGLRARIAQEEKVRGLQIAQIKSEQSIQAAMVARSQARLDDLKIQQAQILAAEKQISQNNTLTKQVLEQGLAKGGVSNFQNILNGAINGQRYLITATKGRVSAATEEQKATAEMIDSYKQLSDFETEYGAKKKANDREILALQNSIRDGEAAIASLRNQINALTEANLTPAQKLSQIRQADNEFQRSLLATLKEQRKTVLDTVDVYIQISNIINGTTDSLSTQVELIQRSARLQRQDARVAANQQVSELRDQLAVARANAGRSNLTKEEKEAAQVAIRNIQDQIKLQEQGLTIAEAQISANEQLAIAQKVMFDTAKEGLEWQQTSLDIVNKQLDAQRALSEETEKTLQARVKLAYQRAGLSMSDEANQALEIRTATQAYKLAVEEVSLKKGLIDLEYALLAAQKDQLMEELRVRRANIDANDPRNTTRLAQIDATLDRLEKVDVSKIADNAKALLDKQIDTARVELETVMGRAVKNTAFGDLISGIRGLKERQQAREQARTVLENARPASTESVVKADTEAQKAAKALDPVVVANNALVDAINRWINVVEKNIGSAPTNLTDRLDIRDAQRYAEQIGLRISERVGEITGKHLGKGHKEGRAFDATIAPGNQDSQNPAYRSKMDQIAKYYQSQGFVVLWNGDRYDPNGTIAKIAKGANQHLDHMHVEIGTKAVAAFRKTTEVVTQAASTCLQDLGKAVSKAADSEEAKIVVNGRKPANDNSSSLTAQVDPTVAVANPKNFEAAENALDAYNTLTKGTIENLKQLGPEGEAVAAVAEGMSTIAETGINALKVLDDHSATLADKFTAVAAVVSSALATVQSALAASAQAKEDAIQREIDAETKRDGKSAESVAKIQGLEKKKDDIARKQFNTNKKLQMAQAVIATAAGVAQALSLGPIVGPILAGVIAAMGAAQIAIISGTQYQSTAPTVTTPDVPSLTIGKRGDSVDVARQNTNLGGELGYLRGAQGVGNNSSNYKVIGSAYGGDLPRGYGNSGFVVGEKGPETIYPETPMSVRPANDNGGGGNPVQAHININALDSRGVADVLHEQRGNIIGMLREAANANGERFMENVDVNVYTRPNVSRL